MVQTRSQRKKEEAKPKMPPIKKEVKKEVKKEACNLVWGFVVSPQRYFSLKLVNSELLVKALDVLERAGSMKSIVTRT